MKRYPTGRMYGDSSIEVLHPDLCCIIHPKVRCQWCHNVVCEECLSKCWPSGVVAACCVFSVRKGVDIPTIEGYGVCTWEWLYE